MADNTKGLLERMKVYSPGLYKATRQLMTAGKITDDDDFGIKRSAHAAQWASQNKVPLNTPRLGAWIKNMDAGPIGTWMKKKPAK